MRLPLKSGWASTADARLGLDGNTGVLPRSPPRRQGKTRGVYRRCIGGVSEVYRRCIGPRRCQPPVNALPSRLHRAYSALVPPRSDHTHTASAPSLLPHHSNDSPIRPLTVSLTPCFTNGIPLHTRRSEQAGGASSTGSTPDRETPAGWKNHPAQSGGDARAPDLVNGPAIERPRFRRLNRIRKLPRRCRFGASWKG